MNAAFERLARQRVPTARASPSVFVRYCVLVVVWLALGPVMGSETGT